MLKYPELFRLSILILISFFIFSVGYYRKYKIIIKYTIYFLLILIFETLRIYQIYLEEPYYFDFWLFILLLFALGSYTKEINQHLFSIKFGLYTLIAAAITYPLIKYAVRNDWLILIAFAFHIVIIVAVIAWLEISVYKYESFSFINLILTPFTFFILFVHFQIEIKPTLVIQKVTKAPAVINNLRVGENTYYVRHAYHQDNYFQLSFSDKAPYLWHGIKVKGL